ncbi:MAG: molybdate ABC transporter substrate-binding protein [Algisphaera sp.]
MFCAAGMKAPVSEIAKQYEEECGVEVQIQYGGSGALLSSLSVGVGDVYLAADSSYLQRAKASGLVAEVMPVAFLRAGLGVPVGNPLGLSRMEDLGRSDLRVGLANPDFSAVGQFSKKTLSQHGMWQRVNPTVLLPTVNDLMNALKLGTVDVVVCWDAVANQYAEIDFVGLPEFETERKSVAIGVLTQSPQPTEARQFCHYLTSKEKGFLVFEANGYEEISESAE